MPALLYRPLVGSRRAVVAGLLQATSLSFIVAASQIGMELDINPQWVNFNLYQPGPDGVVHGQPVYGATGADRYLSPDSRDFIAVLVRGTVIPTGPERVGLPPLNAQSRVP